MVGTSFKGANFLFIQRRKNSICFATQFYYSVGMKFGLLPMSSISIAVYELRAMPTLSNAFIVGIALSVYRRKHLIPVNRFYKGIESNDTCYQLKKRVLKDTIGQNPADHKANQLCFS